LERSGHQVFCDCERELAVGAIVGYVSGRLALQSGLRNGECEVAES